MIPKVADIHTHNPLAVNAVINLDRNALPERPDALYSVGWHPWWGVDNPDLDWVERTASDPRVALVGECGIDRLRGGDIEAQIELTRRHALLAERLRKPLILHIVRAWSEILALRARLKPSVPWIIHGFRGNKALADQLIRAGFILSLGPKAPEALRVSLPPDKILNETDETPAVSRAQ